jgi:hypothetical protein
MTFVSKCFVLVAAASFAAGASAQTLTTETFEGATAIGLQSAPADFSGTEFKLTSGLGAVLGGIGGAGQGNYVLQLYGGQNFGSSTATSTQSFDLLAGHAYTISFDYSRGYIPFGNGPFDSKLTVALGNHQVEFNDTTGFFLPQNWTGGALTFTSAADEPGAQLVLTVSGPQGGYSGMAIDNITVVAVSAVPEPGTAAMVLAGLLICAGARRRAG